MTPSLSLLSRLWLSEPDQDLLEKAVAVGFPTASVEDLSSAYIDLFLLNVYPYGTAFTDPSGELNGPGAVDVSARFDRAGYFPAELSKVGAPDHVGLCLGFLAHQEVIGQRDEEFVRQLAFWLPVCALAIERDSSSHAFYRALARTSRTRILSDLDGPAFAAPASSLEVFDPEDPEVSLSDVVRFLLSPARCGFFLSRSRLGQLGRAVGLALSFAGRFDLAATLLAAAGESGLTPRLFDLLNEEISAWESEYHDLARVHSCWESCAELWLERLRSTRRHLTQMREALDSLRLGYENGENLQPESV